MYRVTLGAWIPVYGGWYAGYQKKPDFADIRRIAELADERRFDSIWIPDHLMNPIGSIPARSVQDEFASREVFRLATFEAWTTLSALATVTKHVKLSNIVLCNLFRNPALLAKMASTLDIISEGRLILGLGTGWFKPECTAYGIPWEPYLTRLEMLKESINVIRSLWKEEEANFTGKHYQVKDAFLEPKPIQKPGPPIWLGGSSHRIVDIAAKQADGWDCFDTKENIRRKVQNLKELSEKNGRGRDSVEVSHSSYVLMAESLDKALELAKPYAIARNESLEEFADSNLLGSAEEVAEQALEFVEVGVDRLLIWFPPDDTSAEAFCDQVLPHLK